ncbi:MAG: hypothetical protein IT445_06380 [Phycisphaeraceae bacterium]|nr:hypothetical protein [Phycisphaeraceae bacterium]
MKMTVRNIKRCLWLLATAALAATVVVVSFGLTPSIPDDSPGYQHQVEGKDATDEPTAAGTTLLVSDRLTAKDFKSVWSGNLRRPLYDPPPPSPEVKKAAAPPPMKFQLLGTILEPDRSQAIVTSADGQLVFPGVGDSVDGAVIKEITADSITVLYYDQSVTLSVPKE